MDYLNIFFNEIFKILLLLIPILVSVAIIVWFDRRVWGFVQRRKGDVAAVYSDTKKFKKTIKMKIKHNNIRKILKSSIKWEKILKNRK